MISIKSIKNNYKKAEPIIIDLLLMEYGEEHREKILEKMNKVYIFLESTPKDNYKYVLKNKNKIMPSDYSYVDSETDEFINIKKESEEICFKELERYAQKYLGIEKIEPYLYLNLLKENDFSEGLIDALSSKYEVALKNKNISEKAKANIIASQKRFYEIVNKHGDHITELSLENVDQFIQHRDEIRKKHLEYLMAHTNYGKRIQKNLENIFNVEVPYEIIGRIFYEKQEPGAGYCANDENPNEHYFDYVKVPIINLLNRNIKSIDVYLIHELIHYIETKGRIVGIKISDEKKQNSIANEIRTQMLAIKTARKLHELGIFIYDDPKDYKLEGDKVLYEELFPISYDFFNEHESFFNSCAINNTPEKIKNKFGANWQYYSQMLDKLYEQVLFYNQYGMNPQEILTDDIMQTAGIWIENMNTFSQARAV